MTDASARRIRRRALRLVSSPLLTGLLLGALALVEALLRSAADDTGVAYVLVLCGLALATTLPSAFLSQRPAAFAVTAATLLSLSPFHSLTVAGATSQLLVLYRLG